jgi:uncharacterized OB-fold protein
VVTEHRIIPTPDGPNVDFYRHVLTGRLHLQHCAACDRYQHPPRYRCPACGSEDALEWVPVSGDGRIHTWTVTHRPVDPGWADEVPYATVVVELDEGVRLVGAWEHAEPADLTLDLPVQLRIEPASDEFAFLWFSPRQ